MARTTILQNFNYKPDGNVLKSFMKDDCFFRGIRGPVGSGKSVACCVEIFRRALQQKKNAKVNVKVVGQLLETLTHNLEPQQLRLG